MRPRASLVLAFCMVLGVAGLLTGCAGPVQVDAPAVSETMAGGYEPASADDADDADAAAVAAVQGEHFVRRSLPGADGATTLQVLTRDARTAPLRYRVIVIPGSGCAGMGPIAERYFAGLLHAQVLVLHKPGVGPQARTAPGDCAPGFVQQDRLSTWLAHARAALQADA
ncbi:MAG: alpha/beta hydrolase, partial [Comamonadaceae bacterium]